MPAAYLLIALLAILVLAAFAGGTLLATLFFVDKRLRFHFARTKRILESRGLRMTRETAAAIAKIDRDLTARLDAQEEHVDKRFQRVTAAIESTFDFKHPQTAATLAGIRKAAEDRHIRERQERENIRQVEPTITVEPKTAKPE